MAKTVESGIVFLAIEANQVSSSQRVSGELTIPQSSEVRQLHDLGGKIIRAAELCFTLSKYCKTFDSLYYHDFEGMRLGGPVTSGGKRF